MANRKYTGIEIRHHADCASRAGRRCNCTPGYRAEVWSARDEKRMRKTFPTLAAAKAWRADILGDVRRGQVTANPTPTLDRAAQDWLAGAQDGRIRNRSGDRYKPSVLRGYEQALRLRILPQLGAMKLADIRRADLQDLVEEMLCDDLQPSTIRNTLLPLRAIFRRANSRGEVSVNPTRGLELPAVRGRRDRIASPQEASRLLAALNRDQALWATAMYAGLRLGELQALRWDDVDLMAGVIRVARSWDAQEGPVAPKSRAGVRTVPIPAVLRTYLLEHRLASGRAAGLVFGRTADIPIEPSGISKRADRTWRAAGLDRITLHECRHTYASFMIAAGVNAKALTTYMGHSSVTITFDRYGHLMPGNESEAAGLLDEFLLRATAE